MLEQILLGTYTRRASQGIYKIVRYDTRSFNRSDTFVRRNESYLSCSESKGRTFSVTSVDEGGTAAYQPEMDHLTY